MLIDSPVSLSSEEFTYFVSSSQFAVISVNLGKYPVSPQLSWRLECQMEVAFVKVLVAICISLGFVCSMASSFTSELLRRSCRLANEEEINRPVPDGTGGKDPCRGNKDGQFTRPILMS